MAAKRETKWYIYSKGSHTNEVVVKALQALNNYEEFSLKECGDDEKRELCLVPDWRFVANLLKSKKDLHLTFEIYQARVSTDERDDSRPYIFTLPDRKKKTRASLEKSGAVKPALISDNPPF